MPEPAAASAHPRTSWWFNRFQLWPEPGERLHFRDLLLPQGRSVPASRFSSLAGREQEIAFFQHGFMAAATSAALATVADRPRGADDELFWQFPCRTEAAAWERHADLAHPPLADGALHVYLGLPWATWIDKARKNAWGDAGPAAMRQQLRWVGVRLSGQRAALAELGVALRVHTVCQHIYWQDMLPAWRLLGVTDLWLSHCPAATPGAGSSAPALHPWRLFAVNVEDASRRAGLQIGRSPADKSLLASFVGAHADHYLSDIRPRLRALAGEPGFVVEVTDKWHFEDVVYQHQVQQQRPLASSYRVDASVERYNALLSDSVFSLCPAGAGPNTLRLWESLAVGSVPVMLGDNPVLPGGGSLSAIDWDRIVLRVADEQVPELPRILRAMPMEEVRRRQRLGMEAFAAVQAQRCF